MLKTKTKPQGLHQERTGQLLFENGDIQKLKMLDNMEACHKNANVVTLTRKSHLQLNIDICLNVII